MRLTNCGNEIALVGRDELESVHIENAQVHLAGCGIEPSRHVGHERRRDNGQLVARGLPQVTVRAGLALELRELAGPVIRALQRLQADHSDNDEQHGQQTERDRELRTDGDWEARDEARKAVYALSSFCIWRKKAKSVPSLMICSGVFVNCFASDSLSAK